MGRGDGMDYRDCVPRSLLLPGQPDRLLAELHEAQTALAIVESYLGCQPAYPSTENTPASKSYAAHEALREARDIIDRVIEELAIQVAGIPLDDKEKISDE
jgi:hypothetical protein